MPALPKPLRRVVPDRVRDHVGLRAASVGLGLIPPRALHSDDDVALLASLARDASRVVEVGVYEGASPCVLCDVLGPGAELHLIDPFGEQPGALRRGRPRPRRRSTSSSSTATTDRLFRGAAAVPGWEIAAEVDRCVAVRRTG